MILTIILLGICFVLGIIVGVYWERVEWNKLIKDGIIPKPKNT